MSSFKLNNKICRICLGDKELLNWNEEIFEFSGISYKDCYYKYTQLDDGDSYYTNKLCEMCAEELKNAHFLFERALESFSILQVSYRDKNPGAESCNIEIFNTLTETVCSNDVNDNECLAESENAINNSKEMLIAGMDTTEPIQFIDIQKLEISPEELLEQQISQKSDTESQKSLTINDSIMENELYSKPEVAFEEDLYNNCDNKSEVVSKDNHLTSEKSVEEIPNTNCITESSKSSTPNQTVKIRKKYILICQYCSLKVDGSHQLKIHEATHSKNRERRQVCLTCGVKFYTKASLNEHMKIHLEERPRNHACEFCEKAFYQKGALNVHRRIHLGLMEKCQICLKEFYRKIDLEKHLPTHSASTLKNIVQTKKYVVQCEYCNKLILTGKLREHTARHLHQPQVQCKICNKEFFSRNKCTSHLRRFHEKSRSEYKDYIHYLVDCNTRMSHLKMKQELNVQTIIK